MSSKRREQAPEVDSQPSQATLEVTPAPAATVPKSANVYQVIGRIRHLGRDIEPGDLVELSKSEAERLFRIGGAIKEV